MQNTKKSLIASGVALLASVALLAGSTFAWFTDSVVNTGNKIEAGTLNIDLLQLADTLNDGQKEALEEDGITPADGEYVSIADVEAPVFDYDKWEPGYSLPVVFQIKNNGTLALRYQLNVVAQDDISALAGVIDVWLKAGNEALTAPGKMDEAALAADGYEKVGTLADVLAGENAAHGNILAGQSDFAAVVLYMQDGADNDYQGLSIGGTLDILLNATQDTHETDGFGSDRYDEGAEMNYTTAGTEEVLADALTKAQDGGQIVLDSNLTATGDLDLRGVKDVQVLFAGHTAEVDNDNIAFRLNGTAEERASATFSGGTIVAGDGTFCTVSAGNGDLVLNDMTLRNSTPYGCSVKAFDGGVITLNNVQSESYMGGGLTAAGGTINVNGGVFTQTGYYDHNSCIGSASGYTGVLNVRDMTGTGENFGFYIFSSGGTINLYSGTYKADTVLKADLDLGSYPGAQGTINVYGGSYDGKIAINPNCTLYIEAGTFANTGLTLEQFAPYVAEGSTVNDADGVFTVTRN